VKDNRKTGDSESIARVEIRIEMEIVLVLMRVCVRKRGRDSRHIQTGSNRCCIVHKKKREREVVRRGVSTTRERYDSSRTLACMCVLCFRLLRVVCVCSCACVC